MWCSSEWCPYFTTFVITRCSYYMFADLHKTERYAGKFLATPFPPTVYLPTGLPVEWYRHLRSRDLAKHKFLGIGLVGTFEVSDGDWRMM